MTRIRQFVRESRKALVPAVTSLVAVLVNLGASGEFDRVEVVTIVGGILTSFLVWLIENEQVVAEVPPHA